MQSIADLLVAENIVRINFTDPFTWTSGIRSPIYCDCRELISIPNARDQVLTAMLSQIKEIGLPIDVIAGTATAGIPWASFIAQTLQKPMLYVRSKPKGHGAGKMVEGRGENDKNVIVVEDALSTGGSSLKSVEALENELNANVMGIFAIFSWDTPAFFDNARNSAVPFHSLTGFEEIATALETAGKITPEERKSLERFHENPSDWWKE